MNMKTLSTTSENLIVKRTVYSILFAISFSHLLNDLLQSVVPSIYPLLKTNFSLSFSQIGMITFVFQMSASILQPFVGHYTDRRPNPQSLAMGMGFTLLGLICLSLANSYTLILVSVGLVGTGSSIFHPEASRVAQLASGGKKGLAQSIFQVGGNAGSAIGPLMAAMIVIPHGQAHIRWFAVFAVLAIVVLTVVGKWYKSNMTLKSVAVKPIVVSSTAVPLSEAKIVVSLGILLILIFSKYFYMASMTSYFTFYLMDKFAIDVQESQICLFAFLASVAAGTILGGPLGDKYGRKLVIWASILGAAPFTLLLPYMDLFGTIALAVVIGVIISSAFSAILVYATDLVPGKVGMVAGLFFGFAFGMGGIGSAVLGWLADQTSISYVFKICSFLPLIGVVTGFLPNIRGK